MVLILIQQQFLSALFFAFFFVAPHTAKPSFYTRSAAPPPLVVFPNTHHDGTFSHLTRRLFSPLFLSAAFFSCKKWKKSREKATHKGKMVMPDVICVPNNNKAIQHPRYVLRPIPCSALSPASCDEV